MKPELEDIIQHYGVKGMRWGVRRIRDTSRSLKRERSWKKVFRNIDDYSSADLHTMARRAQMENEFKKLVRKKTVGTQKDKYDYRHRDKMSHEELQEKIDRMKVKDNFYKHAHEATKEQREFGERLKDIGAPVALKYAKKKLKLDLDPITGKDIFDDAFKVGKIIRPGEKKKEPSVGDKALNEFKEIGFNIGKDYYNTKLKKKKP